MKPWTAAGTAALLTAALTACGYAPVRHPGAPGARVRVLPVRNDTAQAEAGGLFARELRSELAGRGRLADDAGQGPALAAELVSLKSAPTASGADGAAAFRLDAELRVKLGDFEETATGGEDYLAGEDVPGTEANRRAALRRLARMLAREAVERFEVSERMK